MLFLLPEHCFLQAGYVWQHIHSDHFGSNISHLDHTDDRQTLSPVSSHETTKMSQNTLIGITEPKLNQFPQLLEINFNNEYSSRSFPPYYFISYIVQLRNSEHPSYHSHFCDIQRTVAYPELVSRGVSVHVRM